MAEKLPVVIDGRGERLFRARSERQFGVPFKSDGV